MTAPYRLTEEIARYHVEVIFQADTAWQICFSNPTAGPWKLIRIGSYSGGKDLRYIKEEDRPDLILLCRREALFVIIEAKDSLDKFVSGARATNAMTKSVNVFDKEVGRIDRILAAAKGEIFDGNTHIEHKIAVGYLYALPHPSSQAITQLGHLFSEHRRLASSGSAQLQNCVTFVVRQDPTYTLRAEAIVGRYGDDLTFPWLESLPQGLLRSTYQLKGG